jgi:hypothetical protein
VRSRTSLPHQWHPGLTPPHRRIEINVRHSNLVNRQTIHGTTIHGNVKLTGGVMHGRDKINVATPELEGETGIRRTT